MDKEQKDLKDQELSYEAPKLTKHKGLKEITKDTILSGQEDPWSVQP